jgi:hypothetical protein
VVLSFSGRNAAGLPLVTELHTALAAALAAAAGGGSARPPAWAAAAAKPAQAMQAIDEEI